MIQSDRLKQLSGLLTQANLERTLQALRQPMAAAVFVSLGIHGLTLVVLPMLSPSKADEAEQTRRVQAIELSPVEQLRLPQVAMPQEPLPAIGSQSKLPQPSSSLTQPAPLPNDSSLYNFPLIPPPPTTIWNPPAFDPFASIFGNTRPATREAPNPKPSPKKSPSSPTTSPSPGATNPSPSPTSSPTSGPSVPPRSEKLTKEQLAALLAKGGQIAKDRENYTLNAANTSLNDGKKNRDQGLETARNLAKGNLKHDGWQQGKAIDDFYPKEACPFKAGGFTWVGAIVKPSGQPEKLIVLLSSGYAGLDNAALRYVEAYKFEAGDQYQAIAFPFKFQYSESVCPPDKTPPA